MTPIHRLTTAATLAFTLSPVHHVAGQGALDPDAWPRSYKVGEAEIAIYMPQILEWSEFRHLKANAAVGVKMDPNAPASFGAAAIEADTVTDFDRGTVNVGQRSFSSFRFPEMDAATAAKAEDLIRSVLTPDAPMELPLDAMTAAVDRADATTADTPVSFDPPPIFFSDSAAVLVVFIGEPKLVPVRSEDPSLMFAANTNWDLLMSGTDYYLLAGNQWLVTKDLTKGPWLPATEIPASFKNLPDDGNWSDVKSKLYVLPGAGTTPKVFVSDRPAEIVLTEGKPQFAPISGTSLMYVANSESDLFLDPANNTYYFLTTGRWFSSSSLDGPWNAATDKLPDDFANIPTDHPKADVLVSVKGTPEADEAVILASIPQTATITRASTTIQVSYEGEPIFKAMPGTEGVEFAVNTDSDVFRVTNLYYCCEKGIWFQAPAATGSWIVCDKVPAPIYTIPPESPKYNVTHVHVYDSTPDTVHVGSTSGYSGAYVANGLLVFGLGMWLGHELADDDHYFWHGHFYPKPHWYGYGCGAAYHPGTGYYRKGAYCYGPYGGAGYGAAYNPATGVYARGAYAYGPRGAVGAKAAYNPWTNTAAGRVSVTTPYGSWGRSAVVRDDEWIRGGHRSNARGTVAGIETSRGGAIVGVERKYGPDGFIGKTGSGDVYVGKDGNIYKKESGGEWQKRENGGWQGAPDVPPARPKAARTTSNGKPQPAVNRQVERPAAGGRPAEPSTRPNPPSNRPTPQPKPQPQPQPTTRPKAAEGNRGGYTSKQATPAQLNRDAISRDRSPQRSKNTAPRQGGASGDQRRR